MKRFNRQFARLGTALMFLVSASVTQAIGRSGNGFLEDKALGFTADVPSQYLRTQNIGSGGLRLISPLVANSPSGMNYFEVRTFEAAYPELSQLSRLEVAGRLLADSWESVASEEPCVEAFTASSGSARMAVALWGPGKGIAVLAPKSPATEYAISFVISSLKLDNGACTWK